MASGELIFVMKSGQSLRVPVSTGIEDEKEFVTFMNFYAKEVAVDGEVLLERDSSGDLVVLPTENIDYIRGRWS